MDNFIKQVSGVYNLIHNYDYQFDQGEIIKSYSMYIDNILVEEAFASGIYSSGIVESHERYDNDTILFTVNNGIHDSGYLITSSVITNKGNNFTRDTSLSIDDDCPPHSYLNFDYRYYTSVHDRNVYIVPDQRSGFKCNNEYNVIVGPGLSGYYNYTMSEPYSFWFTSMYCPLFTTPQTIKLMGGPIIDTFADDTIYRMIHRNSKEAIDLLNIGSSICLSYDHYGCTPENVPYLLRRYVECKSTHDLIVISEMSGGTGSANSQRKRLGDMDISYGGKPSQSSGGSPDRRKELYDCFNGIMAQLGNPCTYAILGQYDVSKGYPHPVHDPAHNRVIRAVDPQRTRNGPWRGAPDWRFVNKRPHRRY